MLHPVSYYSLQFSIYEIFIFEVSLFFTIIKYYFDFFDVSNRYFTVISWFLWFSARMFTVISQTSRICLCISIPFLKKYSFHFVSLFPQETKRHKQILILPRKIPGHFPGYFISFRSEKKPQIQIGAVRETRANPSSFAQKSQLMNRFFSS